MEYIIIRMPDGTFAKVPAPGGSVTPDPDPPDPTDPPGDWATKKQLRDERDARIEADEDLQDQIDGLVEDAGLIKEDIQDLDGRVGSIETLIDEGGLPGPGVGEEILEIIAKIEDLDDKHLILPVREQTESSLTTRSYTLKYSGGEIYPGPIVVLTEDGSAPAFSPGGTEITGTVSSSGYVSLNIAPQAKVSIVFPVKLSFLELPETAFSELFITELERKVYLIRQVDKIDRDLELEMITPSGLTATTVGENVYLSWAYANTDRLSHFIIEVQDPTTGQWVPFDGNTGVVYK